jgi:F0F1-type ATP synthase assembly protein I
MGEQAFSIYCLAGTLAGSSSLAAHNNTPPLVAVPGKQAVNARRWTHSASPWRRETMSVAIATYQRSVRRVVLVQLVLATAVAVAFYCACGWRELFAALYGGGVTILASLWLGRQLRRATLTQRSSSLGSRLATYSMASMRFVVVLALFAIGLGALELTAPAMIIGFATAKLGFFASLPVA